MADSSRREKDLDLVEDFKTVRAITDDGRSVQVPKAMFGGNLEVATEDVLGGIKASVKSETDTNEVKIDPNTGRLYCPPSEVSMASSEKIGGVVADGKTETYTVEVKIDTSTGKLYVPEGEGTPPDDEDITVSSIDDSNALRFKDRDASKGMGYVILRTNKPITEQLTQSNTIYEIRYDFDLGGEVLEVPANCVLKFKGGKLLNGNVIGSETRIESSEVRIFESVVVGGSWLISSAYSQWFDFVEGGVDNIQNFRNLMVLSTSGIYTHVYIQEGVFYTSTWRTDDNGDYKDTVGISVPSNVYIHNSATIKEVANAFEKTSMFYISDEENITIEGGKLVGGISNHTGTTGEWGMGIYPVGARNVVIKNIEICEFWGDGIDIQSLYSDYTNQTSVGHCKNILIDNVRCLNNRRQGISIESVDGLIIRDSEFSGTGSIQYIAPGASIDIEPWHQWQVLCNITIENCSMFNNKADGLLIHLPSEFTQEHNIRIFNCKSDKGIWTKNVNGLYVDGFIASGNKSYLCLFNKNKNIHVANSSFKNEIYFNGQLENIVIDKCSFDMTSAANWNGYGLYLEASTNNLYENITFNDCILKFNDKTRSVYIINEIANVSFVGCWIESNATYTFPVGYGNLINNHIVLYKANGLTFKNRRHDKVKIEGNEFYTYFYSEKLLTFIDSSTITGETTDYDYEFFNNKFTSIGGFWEPFGGDGMSIVKNRMFNNEFDVDISTFVPSTWSFRNSSLISEFYYKSKTNVARTNIPAGSCTYIRVPYKRSSVKISLINKYVTLRTLISSETTVNINPDSNSENKVEHYTEFKQPVKIDATYNEAMPVFAAEIVDSYVYIYVNNNTGQVKSFTIHAELLVQSEYKGNPIVFGQIVTPSLDFKVNITSPCYTETTNLDEYIGKFQGMQVSCNGSVITYNGEKWIDSNGNEFGYLTSGSTGERPNVVVGTFYYDTTISKPIWKVADGWVDATGQKV